MKAIKNIEPLSKWVLRLSVLLLLLSKYFDEVTTLNYTDYNYVINMLFILVSVLLIVGGIRKKANLTIVSSIILTLISAYKIYATFQGNFFQVSIYEYFMILGIGLFFASKGN